VYLSEEIGLTRTSITDKIKKIEENFKKLSVNPDSEIPTEYGFLTEKLQYFAEFQPFLYNIWNTPRIENEFKE